MEHCDPEAAGDSTQSASSSTPSSRIGSSPATNQVFSRLNAASSSPSRRPASPSPQSREILLKGAAFPCSAAHVEHDLIQKRAILSDKDAGEQRYRRRRGISRSMLICSIFAVVYFLFDWWILSSSEVMPSDTVVSEHMRVLLTSNRGAFSKGSRRPIMYERLLALAAHALAEGESRTEPEDLWKEPVSEASPWKPCAEIREARHRLPLPPENSTGYMIVNANGGLNQQRVAICNAVAVARLLNATLVLPKFLLSSVWMDDSQFRDIYQEEHFIEYLKEDVNIVKQLPMELQSLDLQAIGSSVSDLDVMKEAKPSFYIQQILPILLRNRVVYFSGFGNRLSFDPIPFEIQRLRCRCNFHALKFTPKIQAMGDLLVQRMRHGNLNFAGLHSAPVSSNVPVKYLGMHLRFEIDMVAYSMCDFGGGEAERTELKAYRKAHFPMLIKYDDDEKFLSGAKLRELGQCPLTPEEAVLMLAALGFKRGTRIFLAGAHIYGGQSRITALASLYPNLVTKEDLMSAAELASFANHSSQLAALDFTVSTAADVFAMTDSGSQLASLVSGYRMYFGGGKSPTIRPNKKRLAAIFRRNLTIQWTELQDKVRKTVRESKRIQVRPIARSVYRHPRCDECMCKAK